MARAAAILLAGTAVALIRRVRAGKTYYVFPGGGIEDDETPEEAVQREVREELGLEIRVERLLAKVTYSRGGTRQYYFLGSVTGGTFGTGEGPEMRGLYPAIHGTYTPIWMQLAEMGEHIIYPQEVARLVAAHAGQTWPSEMLSFIEEI
jgi:8-oxo-dGTP pyrophosphatase MutT (NUDIX family)